MRTIKNIKKIIAHADINDVDLIEKIDVGFSNDVYSVDEEYILKISKDKQYSNFIRKDIHYCKLLENKLPVPKVLYSGEFDGKAYFIYKIIKGDNLYNVWHISNENQRKNYIKQICDILKTINKFPHEDLGNNWKEFVYSEIINLLNSDKQKNALNKNLINRIKTFVEKNKHVLETEKISLIDWDLHFDNFIVSGGQIVGRLDFERVMTASLDYQMVLVKRMIRNPKKYASENAEKFVDVKDYMNLMDWYNEFYPKMFDFPEIKTRLNLYSVLMCLYDIAIFGADKKLKDEISEYLE